jgi:cytochrome c-type biogenesis protein CcmH
MMRFVLALLVMLAVAPAFGVEPGELLADPALEQRARDISADLRCLVCQNQSIDDSNADLARDLRVLVRERLTAGDSDGEVVDFVVARYGEFVLLKPVFDGRTLVLWLGAPMLLALAALVLFIASRRRAALPAALTAEEQSRIEALVGRSDPEN